MRRSHRPPTQYTYLAFALVAVSAFSLAFHSLLAGPVTGGPTTPSTKLMVYQGTMSISPGRGTSDTLEIGNPGPNGIEITSTGKVYLRPSGIAFDHAAWFDTSAGKTDLYVTGKLYINGAAVPPWPSGGGVSYWQQNSNVVTPLPQGATQRGVRVMEPITDGAWVNKSAVTVVNSGALPTVSISNSTGPALSATGDVTWHGNLHVTSANALPISVNAQKVWYSGNDGLGSGLDADFLDNMSLFFSGNATGSLNEIWTTRWYGDNTTRQCNTAGGTCLCSGPGDGYHWGADGCIRLYNAL